MGSYWSNPNTYSTNYTFETQAITAAVRKKPTVTCSACFETLDLDHEGIKCGYGHHLCRSTCSKTFLNTVLENPQLSIPATCPFCKSALRKDVVENVLEPKQLEKYRHQLLRISRAKIDGYVLCSCPFCDFYEYHAGSDEDVLIMYCKNSSCGKISCVICKAAINETEKDDSFISHNKCRTLGKHKAEFDRLLCVSNTMACPQCGLAGMKDVNCSHITCPKCRADWCYVCGKKRNDLNLKPGETFSTHFADWKTNESRCPMYLQSVSEINSEFPDDAQAALQKFHENRSKMLLKKFLKEIGWKTFNEMHAHFQSVENCGFTLEEIGNAPEHVFRPPTSVANCVKRVVIAMFQTTMHQLGGILWWVFHRCIRDTCCQAGQVLNRSFGFITDLIHTLLCLWIVGLVERINRTGAVKTFLDAGEAVIIKCLSLTETFCVMLGLWLGFLFGSVFGENVKYAIHRAGEAASRLVFPFAEAFWFVFCLQWWFLLSYLHHLVITRSTEVKILCLVLIGSLCLCDWFVLFYCVYLAVYYLIVVSVVLSVACVICLCLRNMYIYLR